MSYGKWFVGQEDQQRQGNCKAKRVVEDQKRQEGICKIRVMNLDIFEKILITLGVFTPMVIWIKSYVIYREYYIKKTTIGEDVRK
ncbi:MAG TPA: hypothetical protein PLA16_06965, partial [Chitinophagales bacterium]|nr:hypothetical protein [Chitinophagales bacterium]